VFERIVQRNVKDPTICWTAQESFPSQPPLTRGGARGDCSVGREHSVVAATVEEAASCRDSIPDLSPGKSKLVEIGRRKNDDTAPA
jgi:hypothetical protein